MNTLVSGWKWFIQAMFPKRCIICRREGSLLCMLHNKFKVAPPSKASFEHVDEVFAAAAYEDIICKSVITSFKFCGISDIAEILATEIIYKHNKSLEHSILVPIPLHWTRKLWRGFNQSEILAQAIAKKIPSTNVVNILKRIERTQQQATLSKKERIQNMKKAFRINENPARFLNKTIILVDDVVASGATLDAAAKVLKNAGIKNVNAVVFARGGK